MKRKPDFEVESFRAWFGPPPEEDKKVPTSKVVYKGEEFDLAGFTTVKDKSDKIIFAAKFKHNEFQILYYIADDAPDKIEGVKDFLINTGNAIGYAVIDMRDSFDSILNEIQSMNNLEKIKNKK